MGFDIPTFILPRPTRVARDLVGNLGLFLPHTLFTFTLTIIGFLIAIGLGFLMGLGIAYSSLLQVTLYPFVVAVRSLPVIAIAPFFVIWAGYGFPSILLIAFFLAFFPIVIATMSGMRNIDPDMVRLMRSLLASEWTIFSKLRFPNSLPYLFDGFKIAISLSIVGVVVGEFIASSTGLGFLVLTQNFTLKVSMAFAALMLLCVLTLALYGAILLLERVLLPWRVRA